MGRLPKPTYIKELEGNPGKRPLNTAEPKYDPAQPEPPKWLCKGAKTEWRRLYPQLERNKLITEADVALFAMYCDSYATVARLTKEIREEGEVLTDRNNDVRRNAKTILKKSAIETLRDCIKQLGFSPTTRARIITEAKGEAVSPFLKFTE
jgi:P27 family predicted phage terminase small subunit